MSEGVRPFSNGSEYGSWRAHNCYPCAKYNPDRYDGTCEIDGALGLAYLGHGTVSDEIARRLGIDDTTIWTPVCPERILGEHLNWTPTAKGA